MQVLCEGRSHSLSLLRDDSVAVFQWVTLRGFPAAWAVRLTAMGITTCPLAARVADDPAEMADLLGASLDAEVMRFFKELQDLTEGALSLQVRLASHGSMCPSRADSLPQVVSPAVACRRLWV